MKSLLLSLVFFLINHIVLGQIVIHGRVLDSNNNEISYVKVEVYKLEKTKNYQLITNVTSDKNGFFKVALNIGENFHITFHKENFKDTLINFNGEIDTVVNLNVILNSKTSNIPIDSITVKSKVPTIKREFDKVVMAVNDFSGSFLDVIKMAPGVSIERDEILLNGHQPAKIYINDIPLNLSGAELNAYLKSIKSSSIASIEIISHPSAQYSSAGAGGIINIKLKKIKDSGFSGNVSMDYSHGIGKFPDYIPSILLNYHKNKIGFSESFFYDKFKNFLELSTNRQIGLDQYSSKSYNISQFNIYSSKFSFFYDITPKQFFGLNFSNTGNKNIGTTTSNTNITNFENINNTYSSGTFLNNNNTHFYNGSLNYIIKTDTIGSRFMFLSDITFSRKNAQSDNNNTTYNTQDILSDTSFTFFNPNRNRILTAQADYKKVYKSDMELSFGGKFTNSKIENQNYNIVDYNYVSTLDPLTKFNFNYYESIYALFGNFKGKIGSIKYQLGLRGEDALIKGNIFNSVSQDTMYKKKYLNFFPSLFLEKRFSKDNIVNFVFNRRVGRPSYSQLNPFKIFFDNYTTREGNPDLFPQYTTSFELGYTMKSKYNVNINYSKTTNQISQVTEVSSNSPKMIMIYQNIGSLADLSLNFNLPFQFTQKWYSNISLNGGLYNTQTPYYSIRKYYFGIKSFNSIDITNTFSISINGSYKYNDIWTNFITKPFGALDLSFKKKFCKDLFLGEVGISDIFYSGDGNIKETGIYNNQKIYTGRKSQSRYINASLIYYFKFGKKIENKKIISSNLIEQRRL